VAFLAQQMAKSPIRRLMRIAWDSVGDIVTRVLADQHSEARFYGLVLIGVDEISYRRGQRYLTCVADHHSGAIIWAKPGRNAATLQAFFELLGDRRHTIKAISIDMSAGYENAITAVAQADEQFRPEVVFDPFHVCQLASQAVDRVRRAEWNEHGKSTTQGGRWIKHARWSLLKAPERQPEQQLARLAEVAATNKRLYRAFLLKEELRLLYHLPDPEQAPEHLKAWLAWASRSKLKPFITLARTIRNYRDGILAAVRLGLSKRQARRPELQGPRDQPPQLRLPRPRTPDVSSTSAPAESPSTYRSPPNREENPFSVVSDQSGTDAEPDGLDLRRRGRRPRAQASSARVLGLQQAHEDEVFPAVGVKLGLATHTFRAEPARQIAVDGAAIGRQDLQLDAMHPQHVKAPIQH
jgi:hypothetical protein